LTVAKGAEFQINTYATNSQDLQSVAKLSDGRFVVTWSSDGQDGSSYGVYGQIYTADGVKNGAEFRINSYTYSGQNDPSVAGLSSGGFVVTWSSYPQDGSASGIYGQLYTANGVKNGVEFQVNTYVVEYQFGSCVAGLNSNGFVVAWISTHGQDGSDEGVYGQIYSASGAKKGAEFRVNTYTTSSQLYPSVVGLSNGAFVVTWYSYGQDGSSYGVYGQRYTVSGVKDGAEFRVNTYATNSQGTPSVAELSDGEFVIVWDSDGQDGSSFGIYGQRYTSGGSKNGAEFQINTYTVDAQYYATVAGLGNGEFVVTWTSNGQDSWAYGVYGQVFTSAGVKNGAEFQVNSYVANSQGFPSVVGLNSGEFVVVWSSEGQDGSSNGIYGRLFASASILTPTSAPSSTSESASTSPTPTPTLAPISTSASASTSPISTPTPTPTLAPISTSASASISHSTSSLSFEAIVGVASASVIIAIILYYFRAKLSVLCSTCNKKQRSVYSAVPPVSMGSDNNNQERNLPVAELVSEAPSAEIPHALIVPGYIVLGSPSAEGVCAAEYPQAEASIQHRLSS
jgi:hypothetical protein